MNGIIRKRVLALLSAVGLVGSATSVTAQAVQSDKPAATKAESQANDTKSNGSGKGTVTPEYTRYKKSTAETDAINGQATVKGTKSKTAADGSSKDAVMTHVMTHKVDKVQKGKSASTDDVNKKKNKTLHQDALTVKQKTGGEHQGVRPDAITIKQKAGGTHNDPAVKMNKNAAESKGIQNDADVKGGKTVSGASAAQNDANKKANQASPK